MRSKNGSEQSSICSRFSFLSLQKNSKWNLLFVKQNKNENK